MSGGVAYIDAFCWLHKVGWNLGRTLYQSPEVGRRMVIESFLKLVEIVRSSGGTHRWCPHPVFDGAPSPAKSNEDARRHAQRRQHLAKATKLEGQKRGLSKEARKHYNAWWRPSPELVHELCIALAARCVPFTVAPHEADGQISYMCNKASGTSIYIGVDSDAAVTIERVFFWDNRYDPGRRTGGGIECVRSEMLSRRDGAKSLTGFSDLQFLLVCVLSGCDYVSKTDHASGVGFATAIKVVRDHHTIDDVISHVVTCGKYKISPTTGQSIRAAIYHFLHPIVYDAETGEHVHRTSIPAAELQQVKDTLGGSLRPLGDVWPRQVAQDMANSVVHPLTRLPFAPPPTELSVTVPRGGQTDSQRTILLGGRIENALRRLPPPKPLPSGPLYRRALQRCGVTLDIAPDREIDESVLVKVSNCACVHACHYVCHRCVAYACT